MSVLTGGLVLVLEQDWLRTLWGFFWPRSLHQFPSSGEGSDSQPVATTGGSAGFSEAAGRGRW